MPEPILVAIAAALAAKASGGLYDLVKKRFRRDAAATKALERSADAGEGSPEVNELAATLERITSEDPEFGAAVRAEWNQTVEQRADRGGVNMQISGSPDKAVQIGGDVHGDISL